MPSSHPNIRSEICWWLECTDCGLDSYNGNVPHFRTEAEMWQRMLVPHAWGWSRRDDGRILCALHSAVAECDVEGHVLTAWTDHPLDDEMVWRFCDRCGSRLEQVGLRLSKSPDALP